MSTWTLSYPEAPWSLNEERKRHWSWRAERTRQWRDDFHLLALEAKIPHCKVIQVRFEIEGPGRLQDICNGYPALKAAVDGLVQAGVIDDDTPEHLVAVTFTAPRRAKVALSTLVVERVD